MQLLKRNALRLSHSDDIKQMWSSSSSAPNNIATDDLLLHHTAVKGAVKTLKSNQQEESLSHLQNLPSQGVISKLIIEIIKSAHIKGWGKAIEYTNG